MNRLVPPGPGLDLFFHDEVSLEELEQNPIELTERPIPIPNYVRLVANYDDVVARAWQYESVGKKEEAEALLTAHGLSRFIDDGK